MATCPKIRAEDLLTSPNEGHDCLAAANTVSRRSVMNMLAAAGVVPATFGIPQSDAALIGLEGKLRVAFARFKKASALNMETYAEFERIRPERPKALLWQPGDPVHPLSPEMVDGKRVRWCNFSELKELSEGHGDDFEDPEQAARAAELAGAYNSYTASEETADEMSGHAAAATGLFQAMADMDEIYEEMLTHVPTTFEGMKAIATGVLLCAWLNEIEAPDGDQADRGIARLISAMTGAPLPHIT